MNILFFSDEPYGSSSSFDNMNINRYKRISKKINFMHTHDPSKLNESYAYDLVLIDYGGMCGGYGENSELSRIFQLAITAVEDNPNTKFAIVSIMSGDWLQDELKDAGFTDILMGHDAVVDYVMEELGVSENEVYGVKKLNSPVRGLTSG